MCIILIPYYRRLVLQLIDVHVQRVEFRYNENINFCLIDKITLGERLTDGHLLFEHDVESPVHINMNVIDRCDVLVE